MSITSSLVKYAGGELAKKGAQGLAKTAGRELAKAAAGEAAGQVGRIAAKAIAKRGAKNGMSALSRLLKPEVSPAPARAFIPAPAPAPMPFEGAMAQQLGVDVPAPAPKFQEIAPQTEPNIGLTVQEAPDSPSAYFEHYEKLKDFSPVSKATVGSSVVLDKEWGLRMLEDKIKEAYGPALLADSMYGKDVFKVVKTTDKAVKISIEGADALGDYATGTLWMPKSAFAERGGENGIFSAEAQRGMRYQQSFSAGEDAYKKLLLAAKEAGIKGIRNKMKTGSIVHKAQEQGLFDKISDLVEYREGRGRKSYWGVKKGPIGQTQPTERFEAGASTLEEILGPQQNQ